MKDAAAPDMIYLNVAHQQIFLILEGTEGGPTTRDFSVEEGETFVDDPI